MDSFPLWSLFLFNISLSILAVELGFRLARLIHRNKDYPEPQSLGTMIQSTLALLAFLLAFTFGIAAERFNDRRLLIVEEANAIGTTYLRAGFLPESDRDKVRNTLREYTALRIKRSKEVAELNEAIAKCDELQQRLWDTALEFGRRDLNSDIGALFVESLNETIDLQSERIAATLYARIPDVVWCALYVILAAGLASIGYQEGQTNNRPWLTACAMVLSFAMVLTLIADLDRPREGFLRANLQPMTDLARKIGVVEAAP